MTYKEWFKSRCTFAISWASIATMLQSFFSTALGSIIYLLVQHKSWAMFLLYDSLSQMWLLWTNTSSASSGNYVQNVSWCHLAFALNIPCRLYNSKVVWTHKREMICFIIWLAEYKLSHAVFCARRSLTRETAFRHPKSSSSSLGHINWTVVVIVVIVLTGCSFSGSEVMTHTGLTMN